MQFAIYVAHYVMFITHTLSFSIFVRGLTKINPDFDHETFKQPFVVVRPVKKSSSPKNANGSPYLAWTGTHSDLVYVILQTHFLYQKKH